MYKRLIVFVIVLIMLFALTSNIVTQPFPRQTDARDSTAFRTPAVQRWGIAVAGKGSDGLWHILAVDSSGNIVTVEPTWTVIDDTTITATTTLDTIVMVEGKFDYVSIAIKESFGYYVGFASTHDSATTYVPPGCVFNGPVNDDSVFVKMEEGTSLMSIIGIGY